MNDNKNLGENLRHCANVLSETSVALVDFSVEHERFNPEQTDLNQSIRYLESMSAAIKKLNEVQSEFKGIADKINGEAARITEPVKQTLSIQKKPTGKNVLVNIVDEFGKSFQDVSDCCYQVKKLHTGLTPAATQAELKRYNDSIIDLVASFSQCMQTVTKHKIIFESMDQNFAS